VGPRRVARRGATARTAGQRGKPTQKDSACCSSSQTGSWKERIDVACQREIVAESQIGNVVSCSCGTVSVNCLWASMRMPGETFLKFAVMIDEAVASIAARQLEPVEPEESTPLDEQ